MGAHGLSNGPIATINMETTPNQIGSKPSAVMSGKVSCRVSSSSGISSMNMLTMKSAMTMPMITTQRLRFISLTSSTAVCGIRLSVM